MGLQSTVSVLLYCIILLELGYSAKAASIPENESVKNMTLTIGLLGGYYFAYTFMPAIIPGLQMVEEQQLLPGYEIEWSWMDTKCQPDTGRDHLFVLLSWINV